MDVFDFIKEISALGRNEKIEISSIFAREAYHKALEAQQRHAEAEIEEIFQKIRQEAEKGHFFCYVDNIDIINQEILSERLGYILSRVIDNCNMTNIWKISWEEPKEDVV